MTGAQPSNARIMGLWRGHELDAAVAMSVEEQALAFARPNELPIRLPFSTLDGADVSGTRAVFYLDDGEVLEVAFTSDETRLLCAQALEHACVVPELTRSLRTLGGSHGAESSAHDRWFGPLLQARREMVGVSDPLRQLAVFDVDRLAVEMARVLLELAAQRVGGEGARARALEALLEEDTVEVRRALGRVALAATTLEGSAHDSRLADWRRWISQIGTLFREADAAWPTIVATLKRGP